MKPAHIIPPPRFTIHRKAGRHIAQMQLWGNFDLIGDRDHDATNAIAIKLYETARQLGARRFSWWLGPPTAYRFSMPTAETARKMSKLMIAAVQEYIALPCTRPYCSGNSEIDPSAKWEVAP